MQINNDGRGLLKLSLPTAVSLAAIMSFNLVDSFFLAGIGEDELASVSLIFPITLLIGSINFGMSSALSSLYSRTLGSNEENRFRVSSTALVLNVIFSSLVFIPILLIPSAIAQGLGVPKELLPHVVDYLETWSLSIPVLGIPILLNSILRSHLNTIIPSVVIVSSCVLNVILDYILIKNSSITGMAPMEAAALATVIGRYFMFLILSYYCLKNNTINLSFNALDSFLPYSKKLIKLMVPNSIINALGPAVAVLLNYKVATLGVYGIALFGVATRIESILSIFFLSLSSSTGSLAGRFIGRNDFNSLVSIKDKSILILGVVSSFLGILFYIFTEEIFATFEISKSDNLNLGTLSILISLSVFFKGIAAIYSAIHNAGGFAGENLRLNLSSNWLIVVPTTLLLFNAYGVSAIFISYIVGALYCHIHYIIKFDFRFHNVELPQFLRVPYIHPRFYFLVSILFLW